MRWSFTLLFWSRNTHLTPELWTNFLTIVDKSQFQLNLVAGPGVACQLRQLFPHLFVLSVFTERFVPELLRPRMALCQPLPLPPHQHLDDVFNLHDSRCRCQPVPGCHFGWQSVSTPPDVRIRSSHDRPFVRNTSQRTSVRKYWN